MADPHLPHALRILARDIHCEDGIATQCIREAADEIERLRLAIRRLAEQDATLSVCDGAVTVTMDATLTDAEREAVEWAVCAAEDCQHPADDALRGLLERLSGSPPISGAGQSGQTGQPQSDRPCTPEPQSTPAEIDRLRSQPCPYVTGNVTRYCTLTPLTLTDAERDAVEAILVDADSAWSADIAATLRGLLERCSQFAKCESDRLQPIATRESDRPQPIADDRLAALEQLAELDEELGLPRCTPNPHATPSECSVPSEWTSRPYWVDPPEGWRWGFPRLYDPATDGDMRAWMVANGYPERLARQGLACTFTEWTETGEK